MPRRFLLLVLLLASPTLPAQTPGPAIHLTRDQALVIGKMIWKNECAGTIPGLTSWNQGETFASLGIGHFIWYPKGQNGPFEESFPELVAFVAKQGAKIPQWVLEAGDCPWNTRQEFMADFESPRMVSLRTFLKDTIGIQAMFAAQRLEQALPKMLESLAPAQKTQVRTQFYRIAAEPHGVYALMDYVNFKGEGVKTTERYKGQGWGLLQVLQGMQGTSSGAAALNAFAGSASAVLTLRVKNSPPERNEAKWLPGWKSRCDSYRQP